MWSVLLAIICLLFVGYFILFHYINKWINKRARNIHGEWVKNYIDLCLLFAPLLPYTPPKPLIDIPKLTIAARKMVKDAIDAFVNRDENLAKKVILSDPEADNLKNLVQQELINDYMVKDGTTASRAVPLLLIARHLERICDHATNIAEDVIYMVQAKVVKHHPEKLKNNHS